MIPRAETTISEPEDPRSPHLGLNLPMTASLTTTEEESDGMLGSKMDIVPVNSASYENEEAKEVQSGLIKYLIWSAGFVKTQFLLGRLCSLAALDVPRELLLNGIRKPILKKKTGV